MIHYRSNPFFFMTGQGVVCPPIREQPVAKWYSIKARPRTLRDVGRVVVDAKSVGSMGQLFIAMSVLDPLELTAMGQNMDLPQSKCGDLF